MKRLLFLMQMLIAFAAGVSAQETLIICDGNATNAYFPFNGSANMDGAQKSQMLYAAEQLSAMKGKKITSITFFATSNHGWADSGAPVNTWNIAEVDNASFTSSAFISAEFTKVATTKGEKSTGNGWTIKFDTPYVYGGGNLLIQGEMPQGYLGNQQFYGENKANYMSYVQYETNWGGDSERSRFSPMIAFTYEEDSSDPVDPSAPVVATFDFGHNPWGAAFGTYDGKSFLADDDATSIAFEKGTATNSITYKQDGAIDSGTHQMRVYTGSTATITAPDGKLISKIEFTYNGTSDGGYGASIDVAAPSATYTLAPTANARWITIKVTLVPGSDAGGGDAGGFVIPEGYNEVTNFKEDFNKYPYTGSSSTYLDPNKPALGWGYASSGTASSSYYTLSTSSSYVRNPGDKVVYCFDKSTATSLDYIITPMVKGNMTIGARGYSYTSTYGGTQYIKVYKVTKNEDGTYNLPANDAEPFFVHDFGAGQESVQWVDLQIPVGDEYTHIAITMSRATIDDVAAEYALMPENPGLKILSFTHDYNSSTNQMYADDEKNATFEGVVKVKNSGNVALKVGRDNYGFTLESQKSNLTIDKEFVAIDKDLAVGEEYEIPVSFVMHIVKNDDDKAYVYSAIRAISQIVEYGKSNTSYSDGYYAQTSWFNFVNSEPLLDIRNANNDKLVDKAQPYGIISGSESKVITISNVGGADAVITSIDFSSTEGFSHNATLPLTIAKGESANIGITISGNEGYKESTITFVYGNELSYTTKKFSATVVNADTYLETFGTQLSPASSYVPDGWYNQPNSSWIAQATSSNVYMRSENSTYKDEMLVSPKISFAEGQTLNIGLGVRSTNFTGGGTDYYLKVYYSADRINWNQANVVTYSADKKSAEGWDPEKVILFGDYAGTGVDNLKVFTLDGIPAGEYYIGFNSGYTIIDYIFGGQLATVENDIVIDNFTVTPGKSMVNYEVSASVSYSNMTNHAAAVHTVALYDGENLIEEKEGADLAAYGKATVEFTFTPHVAGEMNLKVVVKNVEGDYAEETKVNTIAIAEEAMPAEAMAGARTSSTDNYVPCNLNYYNSRSEWYWTADKMTLKEGDIITSITLPYYNDSKDIVVDKFELYLENTDKSVFASGCSFTDAVAEGLKPVVAAENYTWKKAGTSSNHALVTFTLAEPFVYNGENLHAIMINEDPDKTNCSTYKFECYTTSESGSSIYAYNDTYSTYITKAPNRYNKVPVAIFGIAAQAPVLSGIITEAGDALAGATVEAKSGNVIYTATTDADGKYSMEIMQPSLEYVVTVTADGYAEYVSEAMTINEDKTLDVELHAAVIVPIKPAIGYATFYDSEHAVKIPVGAEAYIFTQTLEGGLGIVEFGMILDSFGANDTYEGVIPAGEPVVIKATGDVTLEYVANPEYMMYTYLGEDVKSLSEIGMNLLCGTDEDAITTAPEHLGASDDECYFYALSLNKNKDPESVGFYWMNETGSAFNNKAHKAYLAIPKFMFETDYVKKAFLFNDEEATGIKNVNANRNDSQIYNLAGQRVNGNVKGIVIKNGKKFMVK